MHILQYSKDVNSPLYFRMIRIFHMNYFQNLQAERQLLIFKYFELCFPGTSAEFLIRLYDSMEVKNGSPWKRKIYFVSLSIHIHF